MLKKTHSECWWRVSGARRWLFRCINCCHNWISGEREQNSDWSSGKCHCRVASVGTTLKLVNINFLDDGKLSRTNDQSWEPPEQPRISGEKTFRAHHDEIWNNELCCCYIMLSTWWERALAAKLQCRDFIALLSGFFYDFFTPSFIISCVCWRTSHLS